MKHLCLSAEYLHLAAARKRVYRYLSENEEMKQEEGGKQSGWDGMERTLNVLIRQVEEKQDRER